MNLLQMIEMFVSCFLVVVSLINSCHSSNYILRYSLLCVNFFSIKLGIKKMDERMSDLSNDVEELIQREG